MCKAIIIMGNCFFVEYGELHLFRCYSYSNLCGSNLTTKKRFLLHKKFSPMICGFSYYYAISTRGSFTYNHLLVVICHFYAVLMPYRLKAINKEISDLSYSPAKQKLEEDIEHHVSDTGSELWYHISWSVRLKLAKQCVTIHQYEVSKKMIVERENCKGHYYDFSCKPGSQYEVSVETKSSCYDPLRRKKVFLTEGTHACIQE